MTPGEKIEMVLTSLLCGEFHHVAGRTLKVVVGHHHEHLVLGEGHQAVEDTSRLSHSAVEAFGPLVLSDHQAWNQTGLPPVVQLREGSTINIVIIIITIMKISNMLWN